MKINGFSKLLFVALLVLTGTISALPCRCVSASLNTYYRWADAVVTARVLSVSTNSEQNTTAKLEISDIWKKSLPKQIEVITGSTCAYNLQVDENHLLYLRTAPSGQFATMKCQGNLPLDKAQKSQNWLKRYGKKSRVEVSSIISPDFFEDNLVDSLFGNNDGFSESEIFD
ncbi:MAG: hypothetical protein ABJA66_06225 [Actinomycetota bacterium]